MQAIIAVLVIAAASVTGGLLGRRSRYPVTQSGDQDLIKSEFEEALETVQENYAGTSDVDILGRASIQGMLRQLDPHSTFFIKSEFDDLQTEQTSRFYGIGVTIRKINNRVFILSASPDGPAYQAGLRYGDAITSVDGQNTEDWPSEDVMKRVRGEKGEPVELTIERAGSAHPMKVRIARGEVKLPTVRNYFMIGQTPVGYIGLTGGFSSKTDEEVTTALVRLKQQGMRQLVLDLRGNPGGLLDQAIKVSEKFLPPGRKIVEVRGRDDRFPDHVIEVPENNKPELMPMVILINQRTASASEIVAGALQDNDRAYIVGENSFGKGLVQSIFYLWGGTGLTLTTQKYYTPSGRSIQRDYSNVSFYDYYLNRHQDGSGKGPGVTGTAFHTDLGRPVFGGGGIAPDSRVKGPGTNGLTVRMDNALFEFVRDLVAGQVAGFKEYRVPETQYKMRLAPEDIDRYQITDKLIAAFRESIAGKPQFALPDDLFNANLELLKRDLKREIISAAYGPEAGDEVYLSDDAQLRKAVEFLPVARDLADNSLHIKSDRQ